MRTWLMEPVLRVEPVDIPICIYSRWLRLALPGQAPLKTLAVRLLNNFKGEIK